MMPLTAVEIGKPVLIKKIGGCDETKHFLEHLGFIVGSEITIVSRSGKNLIIHIKDSRIALDQTLAKRIFV